MRIGKEFAHKAEAVKGSVKLTAGRLTGRRRLRAEGRGDRFKGNMKQAGAKVKDAAKHRPPRNSGPSPRGPAAVDAPHIVSPRNHAGIMIVIAEPGLPLRWEARMPLDAATPPPPFG